jgi:hypothetical protein
MHRNLVCEGRKKREGPGKVWLKRGLGRLSAQESLSAADPNPPVPLKPDDDSIVKWRCGPKSTDYATTRPTTRKGTKMLLKQLTVIRRVELEIDVKTAQKSIRATNELLGLWTRR